MNNPLVPQLRPDKNGKLVTRHVIDGASSAGASTLPAPTLIVSQSEPEKTAKEVHDEMTAALAMRLLRSTDENPESLHKQITGALSWVKTPLLENINDALDNTPKYRTIIGSENNLRHHLTMNKGFTVACAAGVHDIGTALSNAGFEYFQSPEAFCDNYFHNPSIKYVSDSNIEEFRVAYLADVIGLDEDDHPNGKIAYYRELANFAECLDDVIKALPVLHAIIKDDNNYMLDDGIPDYLTVVEHVAKHSDTDMERISAFIKSREERYTYEPDLVDEMLRRTTPAMSTGWL